MNREAFDWAFGSDLPPTSKFVLLCLSHVADESSTCVIGQAELAAMAGMSDRALRTALGRLETAGMIYRERRGNLDGSRSHDRYALIVGAEPIPMNRTAHRYTVAWPDGVLKVGITTQQEKRWGHFTETGAIILDLTEFPDGAAARASEREAHAFLDQHFPRAFDTAERATPYMPYGAGFTECYRIAPDQFESVTALIKDQKQGGGTWAGLR